MQRKTLIYQPSGAAPTTPYASVRAPAGAFGDAGGAMAGFGRNVMQTGQNVAQVGQQKQREQQLQQVKQNRRDAELIGFRSEKSRLALEQAELSLEQELADPASTAFTLKDQGQFAAYAAKRYQEALAPLDKEHPLSAVSDPTARDVAVMGEQAQLTRLQSRNQSADNNRLRFVRQNALRSEIDTVTGRLDPANDSFYDSMKVLSALRLHIEDKPGIDREDALLYAKKQLIDHFLLQRTRHPERFMFATEKEANEYRAEMMENGFTEREASIFEAAKPTDMNFNRIESEINARIALAQRYEKLALVEAYGTNLANQVAAGKMAETEAYNKNVAFQLKHVYAEKVVGRLNYETFQQYQKHLEDEALDSAKLSNFFQVPSGEDASKLLQVPDTPEVRSVFELVMAQSKQLFDEAFSDPTRFASRESLAVRELSDELVALLSDKSTSVQDSRISDKVREYNTGVKQALEARKLDRAVGYDPTSGGGMFFPPEAIEPLVELVRSNRGSAPDGSDAYHVTATLGAGVTRQIARSLAASPDVSQKARGVAWAVGSVAGVPTRSAEISSTLDSLGRAAQEAAPRIEQMYKNSPNVKSTVRLAVERAQPGVKPSLQGASAYLSGVLPVDHDNTRSFAALEMGLGLERGSLISAVEQMTAAHVSGITGIDPATAALDFTNRLLGQMIDSGVVPYVTNTGQTVALPHYAQSITSPLMNDGPTLPNTRDMGTAFSKVEEALLFEVDRFGLEDEGLVARAGIEIKQSIKRLTANVGTPFRRDITSRSLSNPALLQQAIPRKFYAAVKAADTRGRQTTFLPTEDGTGWQLYTVSRTASGLVGTGLPSGYHPVSGAVIPMDNVATLAHIAVARDSILPGMPGDMTLGDRATLGKSEVNTFNRLLAQIQASKQTR